MEVAGGGGGAGDPVRPDFQGPAYLSAVPEVPVDEEADPGRIRAGAVQIDGGARHSALTASPAGGYTEPMVPPASAAIDQPSWRRRTPGGQFEPAGIRRRIRLRRPAGRGDGGGIQHLYGALPRPAGRGTQISGGVLKCWKN